MFTLVACSMTLIIVNFLDSIISVRFSNKYGIKEDTIGYIFAIPFFIYIIGCPIVSAIGDRL